VWRPLAQRWRRRLLRRRGSENQARTGAVAAQWANRAIRGSIDFHARSVADRQERANTCPLVNSFRRCRRGISSRFRAAAHATRQLQGIKSTFGPRLSFACTSKLIPSLITSLMPRCVRSIGTAREGRRQASCSRRSRSSYGPLRAYFWAREASSRLKSRRWNAPAYGSRRDSIFHETARRLAPGYVVRATAPGGIDVRRRDLVATLQRGLDFAFSGVKRSLGNTFRYAFNRDPANPDRTVWILDFFERFPAIVVTNSHEDTAPSLTS
jgi:hypothetical protein